MIGKGALPAPSPSLILAKDCLGRLTLSGSLYRDVEWSSRLGPGKQNARWCSPRAQFCDCGISHNQPTIFRQAETLIAPIQRNIDAAPRDERLAGDVRCLTQASCSGRARP